MNSSRRNFCKVLFLIFIFISFFNERVVSQGELTIPISVERNRTIIPVQVGNSGNLRLVFDSGMAFDGILLYNKDYKDSIAGLNFLEAKVPGAGGGKPSTAWFADSASFSVNNIQFDNQRIIILNNDRFKGFPSDGVIGYSILGHFATEIDYDKNLITLHKYDELKVDDSWEEISIYFKNNKIPWIDVSIVIKDEEPVKISTYIDYAAGENIELLERPEQKFNLPQKLEKVHLGTGLSGDIYGRKGKISKLIIGPFELTNIEAAFTPAKIRSKQKDADAILGNGTFHNFNVIFDYKNEKIYLKTVGENGI